MQNAMLILLVSRDIVFRHLLGNIKEVGFHIARRDDVVPCAAQQFAQAGIIHELSVIANEARAIHQRHDEVHPRVPPHPTDFPPIMRLRNVAVIQSADVCAGTHGTLTHILCGFKPSVGRSLRPSVPGIFAKDLPNKIPHVGLVFHKAHPLRANAVQSIQHRRQVLVLNAFRGSLDPKHDPGHPSEGVNVFFP